MKKILLPFQIWFEPICFQVLWQFGMLSASPFISPARSNPRKALILSIAHLPFEIKIARKRRKILIGGGWGEIRTHERIVPLTVFPDFVYKTEDPRQPYFILWNKPEAGGFEPPMRLPACQFSRLVPSTTQPRFRLVHEFGF